MREIKDLATTVARFLNKEKIRYAFVGGLAVSAWGEPRTTRDVDVIMLIGRKHIHPLVNFLKRSGFEASEEDAEAALSEKSHFSVFDRNSEYWLDVKGVYAERDEVTLKRRSKVRLGGLQVFLASPEDTILSKLEFGSERDINDIKGIILRQGKRLDERYLAAGSRRSGTFSKYAKIKREAEESLSRYI